MNKITLKNFFMMLLACLLIIIMMLVQIPAFENKIPFTFTLGLVVMVAACIFILYQTVTISNELYKNKSSLEKISKELDTLKSKEEVETVVAES